MDNLLPVIPEIYIYIYTYIYIYIEREKEGGGIYQLKEFSKELKISMEQFSKEL